MKYDPFQKQAMACIDKNHTVLVAAPTGAGKTVIAEYAIEKAFRAGKQAIYTAPIKALSNQKYRDFREKYGDDKVGILTGDVSLNAHAQIVVMTTEIYRNTLLEDTERIKNVSWVIFDEVHYIDDLERGTVWEESIMFSPENINFVCLSATVPNVDELAEWISEVHKKEVTVIKEANRPVPLKHYYQCQGMILKTNKRLMRDGFKGRQDWNTKRRGYGRYQRGPKLKPNRIARLISYVQDNEQLPCIYFVFGRQRAKMLAEETTGFQFLSESEHDYACDLFWELCQKYNMEESDARVLELFDLVRRGIAYHHAGMLPTLKEIVEQLFTAKALKLIFTTETFALGINMPARSVIFDELRKFHGTHFGNLRTRDYYQMAGRAGRRGMDECGYVYSRINPKRISYPEILGIINGQPEAVKSQFNATYATVLNLYRNYRNELLDIYPESFHHYQSSKKKRSSKLHQLSNKLELLKELDYIEGEELTDKGAFATALYGYELPLSEMHAEGLLDQLNEIELGVLLCGLIFEPRKNDSKPVYQKWVKKLEALTYSYIQTIHAHEDSYKIKPKSKSGYFHLSPSLEFWMKGGSFEDLLEDAPVDEGEIVRYFRMTVQLMRQIRTAPGITKNVKLTIDNALPKINRDIIDAEKQLRA